VLTSVQRETLSALFPPDQVVTDAARLIAYEFDAGAQGGMPDAVVLPHTAQDVQRLVLWAVENDVPLTARGSGTGYTGGAITPEGGVVVSLARMRTLVDIDEAGRQAIVQPGVISEDLNRRLAPLSLFYPPDPSSQSVCTLGGTIAENAGGPHCLKYGVTSNYVLSLQVVLADGRCVRLGSQALDAPEYDLAGLIVGSEGTLAIVTETTLRLRRPSTGVKALMASFDSVDAAGNAVSALIAASLTPATIELMDGNLIAIVEDYLHLGLPRSAQALLIMDVEGYPESLDPQLDGIVEVLRRFDPMEVKVARTAEEREVLWLGRRSAGPAHVRVSPSEYALDVSVPRSRLAEAMAAISEIGRRYSLRVTFLGHVGDGNLHPTLLCDLSNPEEVGRVHRAAGEIVRLCADLGGSIGGEHGVGVEKREYLPAMYPPAEMAAMWQVKQLFDPKGVLNPGKIFPAGLEPAIVEPALPGQPPVSPFAPDSPEEAADGLRTLQIARESTFIAGGQTKWRGDPTDGTVLSTCGLAGIVSISAQDLHVTVRSGIAVDRLQAELKSRGFRIPFANPWPEATAGGVIASNANGPLRVLYGGVRDAVLAVQVALPDGRLLRFGRPLVKDIAGYEMKKLFVGSYGTLGLLTEVTLKLLPLPLARRSLVVPVPDPLQGLSWAFAVLRQATVCSGLVLVSGPIQGLTVGACALICTLEGHPADVTAEIRTIRRVLDTQGVAGIIETESVDATRQWELMLRGGEFVLRAGVAPRNLSGLMARLEVDLRSRECVVDVPGGQVTMTGRNLELPSKELLLSRLRSAAQAHGGYAVVAAGPRSWLRQPQAWGAAPESRDLMHRLKSCWDPAGVLNSQEFGGG
jgi:glycolate oxidase subunit GlcD